jgi:hypothetical protein
MKSPVIIPEGRQILRLVGVKEACFDYPFFVAFFREEGGEKYEWFQTFRGRYLHPIRELWFALGLPDRYFDAVPRMLDWREGIGRKVFATCTHRVGCTGKTYPHLSFEAP